MFERTDRGQDGGTLSPLDALEAVARSAAEDSGAPGLLERVEVVAAVECVSWPVPDPAAALAHRLGIVPRATWRSARGGVGPLSLLHEAAAGVRAGDLDVVLVAGAEAMTPYMRAVKAGESTGWATQPDGAEPTEIVGLDADASHPAETAAGLIAPIFYYPLIEHAHRAAAGRGVDEHVASIASWWAPYSEIAAANEHAWSRTALSASDVATPSDSNRLVSSPYTKVMNANIQVDQAAAFIVCSAEAAAAAGVPREKWVFVEASAGAHDHWFVGTRPELHRSPALAACFEALDVPGHVAHLDLYSCFPSAVQTAALELGLPLGDGARPPTVTGGLAFFGGPANNYVSHSVVELVQRLRADGSDAHALATAVGWYLTKHHATLLSKDEPSGGFRGSEVQHQVDALPQVAIAEGWSGEAAIESYTALYDRDGTATMGIVSVRTPEEGRAFGKSHDVDAIAELLSGEPLGRTVKLDGSAGFSL